MDDTARARRPAGRGERHARPSLRRTGRPPADPAPGRVRRRRAGPPGEIGRALHRQWTAATDDRAREAPRRRRPAGRRRGRRVREAADRYAEVDRRRPAAGSPGSRDGRAGPARRARPRPARAGSTRCSRAGAPEGHRVWPLLRRMQVLPGRRGARASSTCTRRRCRRRPRGAPARPGVRRRLRRAHRPGRLVRAGRHGVRGNSAAALLRAPRRGAGEPGRAAASRPPATPTRSPTGWRAAGSRWPARWPTCSRSAEAVAVVAPPPAGASSARAGRARRGRAAEIAARVLAVLCVAYDGAETLLRQWAPSLAETAWRAAGGRPTATAAPPGSAEPDRLRRRRAPARPWPAPTAATPWSSPAPPAGLPPLNAVGTICPGAAAVQPSGRGATDDGSAGDRSSRRS